MPTAAPSADRLAPFSPAQRPRIIQALLDDPSIRAAVDVEAAATGRPHADLVAQVRTYADEIVPHFSARLHHRLANRLARRVATLLFRVRVGHVDAAIGREIPADASVVFVCNHRSNMDYVLVAFLVAERVAISFAVGEWARIWPLDTLIRGLGAFFVRRESRQPLYRKVLERYVQLAVAHGVTQAVFLEGGLSRDGRLRRPKFGLLGYLTRTMTRDADRDLVFIPVGINYDRVLEDRHLLRDLDVEASPGSAVATALTAARWVARNLRLYAVRQWYRFGYACVNFGPPLSLRSYLRERGVDFAPLDDEARRQETERLAELLMDEIAQVVPVTPVSLVCTALLSFEGAAVTRLVIGARVTALLEELSAVGARLYVPRRDADYFVDVGLRMLVLRRAVVVRDDRYEVVPAERTLLVYYANAIEYFFDRRDESAHPSAPRTPLAPRPVTAKAVVLVHGLARTSRSMARLGQALEQAGYAIFNWDYPSRAFGLEPLIEALSRYVCDAAALAGRVDVVTHSMGGLLARGVLSDPPVANIGRLVMLAPPNHGAQMAARASGFAWAREFYGQALEELRPERAAILNARIGRPRCEFGVIAGTRAFHPLQPTSYLSSLTRTAGSHDGTVDVDETRLPGMTDFITVDANHMFIMEHDDTIRQTGWFLEHGHFLHADAADVAPPRPAG